MNLNLKLDGEEEQPLQYVNRFAINIPSGAATFNLNIVNPGLGNQSYILNPMNPVGQNIVTYQPPMALQSYIALPTEAEGNIIHSLPVGMPVPVGLPVPTGLLQNNFVNTSIIIGNEDCNSPGIIKSSLNSINPENDIKINYIEKPVEELSSNRVNGSQVQDIGVNCSSQTDDEAFLKKPCPLEMSIKAANIDMEFERCESDVPILLGNCQTIVEKPLLAENIPLEAELKEVLKVPLEISSGQTAKSDVKQGENKKLKTEITWENKTKLESLDNGFQESLICEVEEANDDDDVDDDDDDDDDYDYDDDDDDDDDDGGGGVDDDDDDDDHDDDDHDDDDDDHDADDCDDDEEEEEEEPEKKDKYVEKQLVMEEVNSNYKSEKSNVKSKKGSHPSSNKGSFEESDFLPLSQALKLNKIQDLKSNKTNRKRTKKGKNDISSDKIVEEGKRKSLRRKREKVGKEDREEGKEKEENNEDEYEEKEKKKSGWSESDDDVLNLKRIKNEFNYKCFYEPNSAKLATSLVLKIDEKFKKFVRVRNCCSKRECGKKISVQDQKTAHKNFYDLESNTKRDAYLMNCIEHVQKKRNLENAKDRVDDKFLEKRNILLEIENESNGNQKLSDEIQNAINESLKDCVANVRNSCKDSELEYNEGGPEKGEKNTWNFYIAIDRCRRKVCLQFLLKLFQITKSRIKQMQKKILSGTPSTDGDLAKGNKKFLDIWEAAKSHLDGLKCLDCPDCNANPRHRFLSEQCTKEDLFDSFKDFYYGKLGKQPNIKYASYKRFLEKKTSLLFFPYKKGFCTKCQELKKHKKRKQNKIEKTPIKGKRTKESKKQWVVKTDTEEHSSDDEPLLKRRKLKLTIPLKAVSSKTQPSTLKRTSKKYLVENKSKGKLKQSSSRGRDVWSLMLLHLETMPFKECKGCFSKKRHRFLDSSLTTQDLFEDYRKYFLKETNSELGLGFTMYEKYFNRNCNYIISDVDENAPNCPRCLMEETKS